MGLGGGDGNQSLRCLRAVNVLFLHLGGALWVFTSACLSCQHTSCTLLCISLLEGQQHISCSGKGSTNPFKSDRLCSWISENSYLSLSEKSRIT